MNGPQNDPLAGRANELRRLFDAAFAEPLPPPPAPVEAYLVVVAGGERLAVRRSDLAGFARGEGLARAPGNSIAFLGLAGVRGELYPVWSLAGLKGLQPAKTGGESWLLLTSGPGAAPCALACETFEKVVFAAGNALEGTETDGRRSILVEGLLMPVVDVPALHVTILNQKKSTHPRRPTP